MEYLILVICFFSFLLGYKKDKRIYSPACIFNFIWIMTLSLYLLRISILQQELLYRTKYLFLLNVLGFNITYFIVSLFKSKNITVNKRKKLKLNFSRMKAAKFLVVAIFFLEIVYSGGVPLLWKIMGSSKYYVDFGIPSLHGAFCGLVVILGTYSLYKKEKDLFLYIAIGILIISRQIIISIVIEAIIFDLFMSNKKKINIKKFIVLGAIGVVLFGFVGNFRSGGDTMNNLFKPQPQYEKLPDSIKWVYSYITFSISNFNNLVSMTDGNINHGSSSLESLIPTALLNVINIKANYNPYYLISINFNTSTSFPEIYLDFGTVGMLVYGILLALFGNYLYKKMQFKKTNATVLNYSVYIHNVILMFYINMFLYLPIVIQLLYSSIIFNGDDENENQHSCTSI